MTLFYHFCFYLFGLVAVASACVFVTRKSPVAAALWLVTVLFCIAALFVLLDAQFIGAIQVLVYAGAIMVVFLFVIMLLNLGEPARIADARGTLWYIGTGGLAIVVLAAMMVRLPHPVPMETFRIAADSLETEARATGAVAPVAVPLFTEYLLAFEVTSVLLLAAVVGAVVLGRKRNENDAGTDAGTASRRGPAAAGGAAHAR
jgi:NADH-quinone oxidoreductase subunit J